MMMFCRWPGIACAVALALAPRFASATEGPACDFTRLATLDLSFDDTGRPFAPVTLDGRRERFLIDTGAAFGMVSWSTAKKLGLHLDLVPRDLFYMLNGTSMEYYSIAHDVKFGPLDLDDRPFLVMPASWSDASVPGTIAPDTLAHFDIDFDFGAGRMTLVAPNSCDARRIVSWTDGPHVAIPLRVDHGGMMHLTANIDGQEMDAVLDTGSGPTVLRLDEAEAVLGHTLSDADLVHVGTGESNGWNAYRHPFRELSLGGITVKNPDILIMSDKLAQVREPEELDKGFRIVGMQAPPLIVGMSVLRRLHIYLSYKQNILYATAADAR